MEIDAGRHRHGSARAAKLRADRADGTGTAEVTVISDLSALMGLESDWERLRAEGDQAAGVFASHAWHGVWWRWYGEPWRLHVFSFAEQGERIGIAPFRMGYGRLRGLPVRTLGFLEGPGTLHCDLIAGRERARVVEALLDHLHETRSSWDCLVLRRLPKWSQTSALLLPALQRRGWRVGVHQGAHSPYVRISGDWKSFLAGRSLRFRRSCRNKLNRAKRLGELSVEEVTGAARYQEIFPELCAVAERGWKAQVNNAFCSAAHREFFRGLGAVAAEHGWLSVWTLRAQEQLIAFEFHLCEGGIAHAMRAEFDEAYRSYAPGSVLDYHVVKGLFEKGRRGYDQGGEASFYKLRWTEEVTEHADLIVFSPRLAGSLLYAGEYGVVSGVRQVRSRLRRLLRVGHDGPRGLAWREGSQPGV